MAEPWVSIYSFLRMGGAPPADWSETIETALNTLLNLGATTQKLPPPVPMSAENEVSATLYFPPGRYRITRPILILRRQGDEYLPASIELLGDATRGTCLIADFNDRPAILIQGGRAVRLSRLVIQGKNNWTSYRDPASASNHYLDSTYVVGGCRYYAESPHAGVCIDPFTATPLDFERWIPGMGDYYQGSPLSSTGVIIEDCSIRDFVVGISLCPAGTRTGPPPSAPDIPLSVRNTDIESVDTCIALGRSWLRGATIFSGSLRAARVAINTVDYGGQAQPGDCPSVFGASISEVKYVLRTVSSGHDAILSGLTVDNCLGLGQMDGSSDEGAPPDALLFKGCTFRFSSPHRDASPAIGAHLFNFARASFVGSTLTTMASDAAPLIFHNQGTLCFVNCHIGGERPDLGPSFWITGRPEQASFVDCWTLALPAKWEAPIKTPLSDLIRVPHFFAPRHLRTQILPGTLFAALEPGNQPALGWVSGALRRAPLGRITLTVHGDGTATAAGLGLSNVYPGDLIVTDSLIAGAMPSSHGAPLALGKVDYALDQAALLRYVPYQVPSGNYFVYNVHHPRVHAPTRGSLVRGRKEIFDIETPIPLNQSWAIGHKIQGWGIAPGTYIADVGVDTITMSQSALEDGVNILLDDAEVYEVETTPI